MTVWIDAQLSPSLAPWITERLGVDAFSLKWLGLRDAADAEIFMAAREASAVVMTKDADFVRLLDRHGPPPKVILITLGNTSSAHMREVLQRTLAPALRMLDEGQALVEIGDPRP